MSKKSVNKHFFRQISAVLLYRLQLREWLLWLFFLLVFFAAEYVLFNRYASVNANSVPWHWSLMYITLGFSLSYLAFLFVSALCQNKWQDVYPTDKLPGCTVIVPSYNEGKHVLHTIQSLLNSDFPQDKLEIITVNDGSQDDTLHYLQMAKEIAPDIVTVIDLPENRGKKHALYQGFKKARYEFVVTVDSDSLVCRNTLRKILQPFVRSNIGAVAGTIYGKKRAVNPHVRLLDVMLIFGCEFLRKAQSASGNVFCTPGALSAYRKSAVMPLLDEWLEQTFMGEPAKIGEDRAIATLLLRSGFLIVHQPQARAETCLPETYRGVCKMMLRWTRSDIRENILMIPMVFKNLKHPGSRSINLFIHWLMLFVNMLLPFIFLPLTIYITCTAPDMTFQLSFFYLASALWGIIPAIVYVRERQSFQQTIWAFLYGFYTITALSWIGVYSVITVKNSHWLTREIKARSRDFTLR